MPDTIDVRELPLGSILAATNAVAIKRYDPLDEDDYWMPAEGYPLPLSNQQMQNRVDSDDTYRVLRVGTDESAS